jgi:hypothetical protein
MPLIAKAYTLPLESDLVEQLVRLQPPISAQSPSSDAILYVGWFNSKAIAAAWAVGADDARMLSGFAIHPATRGREVLAQLASAMRTQENAAGQRVASSEDYFALDMVVDKLVK